MNALWFGSGLFLGFVIGWIVGIKTQRWLDRP